MLFLKLLYFTQLWNVTWRNFSLKYSSPVATAAPSDFLCHIMNILSLTLNESVRKEALFFAKKGVCLLCSFGWSQNLRIFEDKRDNLSQLWRPQGPCPVMLWIFPQTPEPILATCLVSDSPQSKQTFLLCSDEMFFLYAHPFLLILFLGTREKSLI